MKKYLTTVVLQNLPSDADSILWQCLGPLHPSKEYGSKDYARGQSMDPDPTPLRAMFVQSFEHIKPGDVIIERTSLGIIIYKCTYDWLTSSE